MREPNRGRLAVLVAVALVVGAAGGASGVTAQTATDGARATPAEDSGETNSTAAARLMGTVGVTEAEVEGEVERRAFGIAVARAATNDSKVGVVADQFNQTQERLAELRERKEALTQSRAEGEISEAAYEAQIATLAARVDETEERANETQNATAGLPAEKLERKGINATAIRRLKQNASELSGPEVSRIARSIAGPPDGRERGPPEDRGPDRDENETETGDDRRGPPDDRGENEDEEQNETETGDDRREPPDDRDGDENENETETGDDGTENESGQARPPEDPDRGDGSDDGDAETAPDGEDGSDDEPGKSGGGR